MAGANLPAKKYKKTSPTVTRLSFEGRGGQTEYIDIAKALSIINRKFYRQGLYYYVNSIEVYNNETGVIDIHTAPDNWVTKNAHSRGFKLFQKMNALATEPLTTGQRGAYHDFKVFLDNPKEYSEEKWFYEEEDLNSRFEFENNHYKRSMNILKKVPEMIKEFEENKDKEKIYDKNSDNDKERILKLIYYHKVNAYL